MVTGSSTGIGRAIAIRLAQQGANVILHGRTDSEAIQSVSKAILDLGGQSTKLLSDFSTIKSWDQFVTRAWSWQGDVDIWINNAGGDVLTGDWPARDLEEKLNYLVQVDVTSTLMLSRGAGERMKNSAAKSADKPGVPPGSKSIINIGWDQAWQGMAGTSGELFSTTKGAIMAMSKSLAQSFAPEVRVNCIAPGWIQTKWGEQASTQWDQRAQAESLMKRWGTPEDVANATAFLCSDQASFISGQVLPVNGGFDLSQGSSVLKQD